MTTAINFVAGKIEFCNRSSTIYFNYQFDIYKFSMQIDISRIFSSAGFGEISRSFIHQGTSRHFYAIFGLKESACLFSIGDINYPAGS